MKKININKFDIIENNYLQLILGFKKYLIYKIY